MAIRTSRTALSWPQSKLALPSSISALPKPLAPSRDKRVGANFSFIFFESLHRMTYYISKDGSVYDHLLKLKESLGPKANRRERMVVMIGACIDQGFNERQLILKGLRVAGLSREHVIGVLDGYTGTVPGLHLWWRDEDRKYHLLDP
ncbi:hypothetical protein AB5I39_10235 [Sphingomonas sp. MMS24-J45]|uniref:hypothetical protein n=1 Tax=Sphingomonas sp. MMS24-J45 TaxID=3238806 RepID=UPI003850D8A4